LGFLVIRKSPKDVDPSAILKGPINTQHVRNIVARAENVFLRVDIYPINPYILLYERKK